MGDAIPDTFDILYNAREFTSVPCRDMGSETTEYDQLLSDVTGHCRPFSFTSCHAFWYDRRNLW